MKRSLALSPGRPRTVVMWWFVGIVTYALLAAVVWMFIRGATARECPKPQQATANLSLLPQMHSEATASTMAFARERRSV